MRIAIDLTSLSDNFSGLERSALELTKALVAEAAGAEFVFVIKNEVPAVLKSFGRHPGVRFCRVKGKNKLLVNQIILPLTMSRIKADAYIFPAFPVPLVFHKKNTYGMIADLGCFDCPQTMKKKQVVFFREGNKHTVRVCRKVLTVSEFSAGRIEDVLRADRDKILLVYNGINKPAAQTHTPERIAEAGKKYSLPDRYLLSLSTVEPRKNLRVLIEAYLSLIEEGRDLPSLVLAGRQGWMMEEEMKKAVESGRILFTGFVDEEDLPAVYAGAECFVFPSLYEGFGMPPLEAQAAGVRRVLASDAEALTEVLGETALYFRNNDAEDLKRMLPVALEWSGAEPEVIEANLERFSWERSAEKLWGEMRKEI